MNGKDKTIELHVPQRITDRLVDFVTAMDTASIPYNNLTYMLTKEEATIMADEIAPTLRSQGDSLELEFGGPPTREQFNRAADRGYAHIHINGSMYMGLKLGVYL